MKLFFYLNIIFVNAHTCSYKKDGRISGDTSIWLCLFTLLGIVCSHCHVRDSSAILCFPPPGVLEDGLSSNGVPRSAAPGGISNPEKMSCGTQCPNPQSLSSGSLTQKQNGLRTTEVGHSRGTALGLEKGREACSGVGPSQDCTQGRVSEGSPRHQEFSASPM